MSERLNGEIVIVDDQPDELENLRKFLIHEHFDARIVRQSGEIFSSPALTESFLSGGYHQRIFVVSLDLTREDPIGVFEKLFSNFPDSRFAFIANSFDSERAEEIFAAGVDAFFTKPVSIEKFISWASDASLLAIDTGDAVSTEAA